MTAWDGEWLDDPATLDATSSDFGRLTTQRPRAVLRAGSVEDVVRAVALARQRNWPLTARGQGHSTRGQASVAAGLIVDLRALNSVRVEDNVAVVGAGGRWSSVVTRCFEHGLTPPTLTDYLELSVGGTLSVAGVGGQSFRYGLQSDQVDELVVVTGNAEVHTCSPSEQPQLFDACRAGLGQCAVIVQARLRLVTAPSEVQVWRLGYSDLGAWLNDQTLLASSKRFDYLLGSIVPTADGWGYRLEAAKYARGARANQEALEGLGFDRHQRVECSEWPFLRYARRLEAMEVEMRAAGSWQAVHPWMDLFVPSNSIERLIRLTLESCERQWLNDSHTLTYPLTALPCQTPLAPVPRQAPSFLFGVGPNFAADKLGALARFERACEQIVREALEHGAGIYPIGFPVGTPSMGPTEWRRHFGQAWPEFAAAKQQYDPEGLLNPIPGLAGSFSP